MVSQKYRWDFIGLSTDTKPTSETSDKVVNGSTYYCSDTSKLYVYCDGTWYERKPLGGGGGGGTSDFNDLSNRPKYNGSDMTGSTNIPEVKTYTAGSNVAISDQNVISATDTTYSAFTGTDGTAAGVAGLVPAPATTDAGKFLKADGTWDTAGGGGPTVVQTTGTSTTDVMSQNAATSMVFDDPAGQANIKIGDRSSVMSPNGGVTIGERAKGGRDAVTIGGQASGAVSGGVTIGHSASGTSNSVAIGYLASSGNRGESVAIGHSASTGGVHPGSVALGAYAICTRAGEVYIGSSDTSYGYNSTNYRVLGGVHDPQSAHDAATKGYVDPTTDSSAPTTATVGRLGQIQIDTTTATAYMCVAVDTVTPAYTWKQITA